MNTIALMDKASRTLRTLPPIAWLWWSSASMPFALACIGFITEMGSSAAAAENLPSRSLLLGMLYLWLGVAQNIFCLYVRAGISGEPAPAFNPLKLLRASALLQGTSLLVVPVGLLSVLGGPPVFAFYQNAAAYPDPHGTGREAAGYALREALRGPRQGFVMFWLLAILGMVVFLNVAVMVVGGPFLLRMLTGEETAFTRSPIAMVNGTTFAAVLAVLWLCMDPFVKAVYVHRCFAADSLRTGADLRATLRSLGKVAASVVVLCSVAAAQVAPDEVGRAIRDVAKRPEYVWRSPRTAKISSSGNAFVRFTEDALKSLGEMLHSWTQSLAGGIEQLIKWLFNQPNAPIPPGPAAAAPQAAGIVLVLLIILLAGVLAFLVLRSRRRAAETVEAAPAAAGPIDLASDDVSPALLDGDEWLDMADRFVQQGDYRMAARAVFLSLLASLGNREVIAIHRAKSNLEYARELARRTRGREELHAAFRDIISSFERTWYGEHEFTRDVFDDYRARAVTARHLAE